MNTLIAMILLVQPPLTCEQFSTEEGYAKAFSELEKFNKPEIREAIRTVALEWEILDPREVRWVLVPNSFINDLNILRNRYKEFHNAPFVADAERFAPACDRRDITEMIDINARYRVALEEQRKLTQWRYEEYTKAIEETNNLFQIWDALRDARQSCYYITVQRAALVRLRNKLGNYAYYTGTLPPIVPLHRFIEVE